MIKLDKKTMLRHYKTLLNHWQVVADKNTINELENFCKTNEFEYTRTDNIILLLEETE